MANTSDDSITGDIIAAFAASPCVRAADLRVHTARGWVRLEGVVDSLEEKTAAEEVARTVKGVVAIENDLVISRDGWASDLDLEREVADHLAKARLAEVGVRVKAGVAFLMGVVSSLAVKQKAVRAAASVKGVRTVVSELEIAAGEPVDDTMLANDVSEALSDDPELEIMDLRVQAEDGLVLIGGNVSRESQLAIATAVAEAVPGVRYVENRLRVHRPTF